MEENMLPCFVGFYVEGRPLNEMCNTLEQRYPDETNKGALDGVYNNDSTDKCLFIAIPEKYNLNMVTSTGFQVPMQGPTRDFLVKNGCGYGYKIYQTMSRINPGPMNINCHLDI